jgi:cell division protein FtsZ
VIDDTMGEEVRVTVIATGFDRGGPGGAASGFTPRASRGRDREEPASPRDRSPRISDSQRSSLEISDDDIDIPPFLR